MPESAALVRTWFDIVYNGTWSFGDKLAEFFESGNKEVELKEDLRDHLRQVRETRKELQADYEGLQAAEAERLAALQAERRAKAEAAARDDPAAPVDGKDGTKSQANDSVPKRSAADNVEGSAIEGGGEPASKRLKPGE
eukprot:gene83-87_t